MPTPDATAVGLWLVGAAAVVAAVVILGRFALTAWRGARKIGHFLDDWFGEPGRPGHPARPGVPARLEAVEDRLGAVETKAAAIEHELHPNSGHSMRDALDRVEKKVTGPPVPTIQQTIVTPPPDPGEPPP